MAAFAKELRACLAEEEGHAPAPPDDDLAMTLVTPPAHAAPPAARPRPPARRRRRPLVWVLIAVLIAVAAFGAVLLLGGGGNHGVLGRGGSTGSPVPLQGVGNAYSNPGHPDSHADTAKNATDGSAATYWYTQTYGDQTFGGLLTGLGLVLDAGTSVKLAHLTVTTPTGFTGEIQSGDSQTGPFTTDSASQTLDTGTTTFTLNGNTARYYVVWITELPPQLYAQISEVTAKS